MDTTRHNTSDLDIDEPFTIPDDSDNWEDGQRLQDLDSVDRWRETRRKVRERTKRKR